MKYNVSRSLAIATTAHKITPSNSRIASLLTDVDKGNIEIPIFQREFVWKHEQIISLLDSIYHGYPVGSLLLWSTKEPLKHERNVGGFKLPLTPEDYPVQYVLDGQQRLSTLYGVFHSDAPTAICLLAQLNPKSFLTGAPVDLSDALSAYNAREFHHIYPKGYLASQGIHFHEANVIANICMLTAADNNEISDANPAEYFPQIPGTIRDEVFQRALVPDEFRGGTKVYADFVKARAGLLATKAGSLILAG